MESFKVKQMALMLAAVAACYSEQEIKDSQCKVYCRTGAGYDSGVYVGGKCWCADVFSVSVFEDKKITFPYKVK